MKSGLWQQRVYVFLRPFALLCVLLAHGRYIVGMGEARAQEEKEADATVASDTETAPASATPESPAQRDLMCDSTPDYYEQLQAISDLADAGKVDEAIPQATKLFITMCDEALHADDAWGDNVNQFFWVIKNPELLQAVLKAVAVKDDCRDLDAISRHEIFCVNTQKYDDAIRLCNQALTVKQNDLRALLDLSILTAESDPDGVEALLEAALAHPASSIIDRCNTVYETFRQPEKRIALIGIVEKVIAKATPGDDELEFSVTMFLQSCAGDYASDDDTRLPGVFELDAGGKVTTPADPALNELAQKRIQALLRLCSTMQTVDELAELGFGIEAILCEYYPLPSEDLPQRAQKVLLIPDRPDHYTYPCTLHLADVSTLSSAQFLLLHALQTDGMDEFRAWVAKNNSSLKAYNRKYLQCWFRLHNAEAGKLAQGLQSEIEKGLSLDTPNMRLLMALWQKRDKAEELTDAIAIWIAKSTETNEIPSGLSVPTSLTDLFIRGVAGMIAGTDADDPGIDMCRVTYSFLPLSECRQWLLAQVEDGHPERAEALILKAVSDYLPPETLNGKTGPVLPENPDDERLCNVSQALSSLVDSGPLVLPVFRCAQKIPGLSRTAENGDSLRKDMVDWLVYSCRHGQYLLAMPFAGDLQSMSLELFEDNILTEIVGALRGDTERIRRLKESVNPLPFGLKLILLMAVERTQSAVYAHMGEHLDQIRQLPETQREQLFRCLRDWDRTYSHRDVIPAGPAREFAAYYRKTMGKYIVAEWNYLAEPDLQTIRFHPYLDKVLDALRTLLTSESDESFQTALDLIDIAAPILQTLAERQNLTVSNTRRNLIACIGSSTTNDATSLAHLRFLWIAPDLSPTFDSEYYSDLLLTTREFFVSRWIPERLRDGQDPEKADTLRRKYQNDDESPAPACVLVFADALHTIYSVIPENRRPLLVQSLFLLEDAAGIKTDDDRLLAAKLLDDHSCGHVLWKEASLFLRNEAKKFADPALTASLREFYQKQLTDNSAIQPEVTQAWFSVLSSGWCPRFRKQIPALAVPPKPEN